MGYLLPRTKMIFSKPALIDRFSWCFSRRPQHKKPSSLISLVWSLLYKFLWIGFLSSLLILSLLKLDFL